MKDIKPTSTEEGFDKIGEYIDYWFDSIHSCGTILKTTKDFLEPPVIVVCTGIDNCKETLPQMKEDFRKKLVSLLGSEEKIKHLRRICYVSNTEPSEKDFDYLRKSIFEIGRSMKTCGEMLPLRWINLERSLDLVRESGVNILPLSAFAKLASEFRIENQNEIQLFLRYQHKKGNIIYFDSLEQHIILNQKWLADAFRCLVSDQFDDDLKLTIEWGMLEESGELDNNLIAKLFKKEPMLNFSEHKALLLNIMEMFGIIVKLKPSPKYKQSYYMPCMIDKEAGIRQVKDCFGVNNTNCTPWLCVAFDFMPLDLFNYIFCYFVRRYRVCTEPLTGKVAMYHGMGVFFLDDTDFWKFVVCFSKNAVLVQIWYWQKIEPGRHKSMLNQLILEIEVVKVKYEPRRIDYVVKLMCPDANIYNSAGRFSYQDLKGRKVFCNQHSDIHDTISFSQSWFEDYIVGQTPLHLAAYYGQTNIVQLFVSQGIKVDIQNQSVCVCL